MAQLNDLIVNGSARFLNTINGNISGTSSNVTGTVAVANGGTGATTAQNARANLSVPYMYTDTYPTLQYYNGTNTWIKIGTSNTSYGILPSATGNAGSGHNYIGTSTWYWKYSYIDEMNAVKLNGVTIGSSPKFTDTTYSMTRDGASVKLTPSSGTAQSVGLSDLINGLSVGSSPAEQNDYLVAQYAGGGTTTTSYHRRAIKNIITKANVDTALGKGTSTTTYYRNDGTWATPTNTTYSAGAGLELSGTTFKTQVPRVAEDSKTLPGKNTLTYREYTAGTGYNLPSNHWYYIFAMQGSDVNYGAQLALGMTVDAAYYRVYNANTWGSWHSIINTNTTYNFSGTTFYSGASSTAEHNANNATYNGNYYYTSGGPAVAQGASTTDGALYAQAYSTSWVGQIAQDYRNGKLQVRGKNNGTWYPWLPVMTFEDTFGLNYTATKFLFNAMTREIKANKSTSAWDSQVYSSQGYVRDCVVTFKPSQTNMDIMMGLDANPTEDANYNKIDYCWYIQNDGKLNIYESGSPKITAYAYAVGDELRIEYDGNNIRYIHNGEVKRTVARAISGKLYMDSSFHGASGAVYDFDFGVISHADSVYGIYTSSGGQQGPSFFGKNRAGFLMSNATVAGDSHYKNWLYMDNYSGGDVGGATAIGVDRMEPRMFIMQSDANRTSWNNTAAVGVFTATPTSAQFVITDGTTGGIKSSGYSSSSFATSGHGHNVSVGSTTYVSTALVFDDTNTDITPTIASVSGTTYLQFNTKAPTAPTVTLTKSSGTWTAGSVWCSKWGNVVTIEIQVKGAGATVAAGIDGFVGKISGVAFPKTDITLIGYTGSTVLMGWLDSSGNVSIRASASTSVASGGGLYVTGTYICK